jgi:branched-chain amino acid transport system substrate-binding protein
MRSKSLSRLALVVTAIVALPGLVQAQQPIRIGASIAITGRDAIQGGYVREGYLLCQKHVNDKGGVRGRPMEFLIRDDGSDPQTAVGLYEKLIIEDRVDVVMGPYGSPITDAVADVTEKHRKLMIAPAAARTQDDWPDRCPRPASHHQRSTGAGAAEGS